MEGTQLVFVESNRWSDTIYSNCGYGLNFCFDVISHENTDLILVAILQHMNPA